MPRAARTVAAGQAHHVTQRGNNRQAVFFVDGDRRQYLKLLKEQSEKYGLEVHAYCLMTNHIHLVVVPVEEESLAKAVGGTHFSYTQYINRLHDRGGHLWQNRFFSCVLDDEHYWYAIRYLERNPVRARLVRKAWRYPWSSALAHISGDDETRMLDLSEWRNQKDYDDWQGQLVEPEDEHQMLRLRSYTRNGRPLGSDSFVSKLERIVGRRLRAAPIGRPQLNKSKKEVT